MATASSRNLYLWKLRTDDDIDALNASEASRVSSGLGGLPPGFYDVEPDNPAAAKKKKSKASGRDDD